MVKFHLFSTPANKPTITAEGPRYPREAFSTVEDTFHALSVMGTDGYTMHESLEGCRSWVYVS